ncbi:MAG: molecular chaperone TorD family protein [Thaumarchaeota archaeon]|nr:molecular chaperone TorD family protein [Nitrososphaerota archaeon]
MFLQNASSSKLFNIRSGGNDLNHLKTDFQHLAADIQEHLSSEEHRTRLSVEWTKLFRGVKPGYSPLPPYESLYLGGWLDGSLTTEIRNEYLESHFDLSNQWLGEPQDHIGLELGYLSFLSRRESEAWANEDFEKAHHLLSLESGFLKKHLAVWISQLSGEIKQYDEIGIYGRVAEITETWIGFDSALLAKHSQCVESQLSH